MSAGERISSDENFETVRYRKKSKKKPPRKANHKHESADCVFEYTSDKAFYGGRRSSIGLYCPICGKIINDFNQKYRINLANPPRYCMDWSEEGYRQLDRVTRTLPTFHVTDWFRKYVNSEELK